MMTRKRSLVSMKPIMFTYGSMKSIISAVFWPRFGLILAYFACAGLAAVLGEADFDLMAVKTQEWFVETVSFVDIAFITRAEVSFQWKDPDFLLKNPDFLLQNC